MITIRKSDERGKANFGWLDSRHTFSFGDYYDPEHVQFGSLRVINEDWIAGGGGFGTHPHRNMEIVTYVVSGALEHKDSMGNGAPIRPGELQRMTAGSGLTHSEFNHSKTETVHLLQIWIVPERTGLTPSYEQKSFATQIEKGGLVLLASSDAKDGSLKVHQDMQLFGAKIKANGNLSYTIAPQRQAWLQLIEGSVSVNGQSLSAGDAAAITNEAALKIAVQNDAHFLLFDLKADQN